MSVDKKQSNQTDKQKDKQAAKQADRQKNAYSVNMFPSIETYIRLVLTKAGNHHGVKAILRTTASMPFPHLSPSSTQTQARKYTANCLNLDSPHNIIPLLSLSLHIKSPAYYLLCTLFSLVIIAFLFIIYLTPAIPSLSPCPSVLSLCLSPSLSVSLSFSLCLSPSLSVSLTSQ